MFGNHDDRVHILTGANYSGKSVYGKQVALIAYLAHIGMFVPADFVSIRVLDRICTLMYIPSFALELQSSFMKEVQLMGKVLKSSTVNSLIIIDEFGKGTCYSDGISLLSASIQYLINSKGFDRSLSSCHWPGRTIGVGDRSCPLTLITTHYYELLDKKVLPRDSLVKFFRTRCVLDEDFGPASEKEDLLEDHAKKVVFLYKVLPLNPNDSRMQSLAIECGQSANLPQDVLSRASALLKVWQHALPEGDLVYICDNF